MRMLKLGAVAILVTAATFALLWVTEAVPREQLADAAPKAFAGLAVLVVAAVALGAVVGRNDAPDSTDKPVP